MIAARSIRAHRLATFLAVAALVLAPGRAPAQSGEAAAEAAAADATSSAERTPAQRKADRKAEAKARKEAKRDAKEEGKPRKQTKEEIRRAEIESSARTAPEWYAEALERFRGGKYLAAREILLPLEDSARAADIQESVKLLIADTYFQQGGALNLAEALARYKSFLTFYPGSEHVEYAQFQLGRSYFKQLSPPDRDQSLTESAIAEYQKLLDGYPESKYAEQAKRDLLEAKAIRARHEFLVAEYYYDTNDYAAAAGRLMAVLKDRPELPERERAIAMAAQSLYNLGRRDEADAYAARLSADYPGTSLASRLNTQAGGAQGVERMAKREANRDKDKRRTHAHQLKTERRRTRQIRKDSGLPKDIPATEVYVRPEGEAAAVAAAAASPESEKATRKMEEQTAEQRAKSEELERKETEEEEKERVRGEKRAADIRAEKEKEAAKEAEKAAARGPETPEQAAKREKQEAEEKARIEKLEAEDAEHAEEQAEKQRRAVEKQQAEAEKKAAKKRKKQEKKKD